MTSTKTPLERVQLKDTQIKLIMSQRILNQIKYLCRNIPKVEWSGVLFYSVEGSIKDPKNMVLTIEDIFPMHKGTSSYTEYSFDQSVLEYMIDNETMEKGWKMGHIHSHNTMAVFFSGTDWSELEDNAPNHNFYLSLIVNNFMDFCAKVCFISQSEETKEFSFYAKDENGERYLTSSEKYEAKEKKLIVYDCDITSPNNDISVDEYFSKRVSTIIEEADKRFVPPTTHVNGISVGSNKTRIHANNTPSYQSRIYGNDWEDDWNSPSTWNKSESFQQKEVEVLEEEFDDEIEHFAMFVLNTGNSLKQFADVEDIVKFYQGYNLSPKALSSSIMEKYHALYEKFFDKVENSERPEIFIEVTQKVIEEYVHTANTSFNPTIKTMLDPTIQSLESMLDKFKNHGIE